MSSGKDENDRLREGSLPADPSTGTERAVPLRVVRPGEERASDMPEALDSERALLAALLWAGANAPDTLRVRAVVDLLETGEPFRKGGAIFDAMRACAAAGAEHDPVAVHVQLVCAGRQDFSLDSLRSLMNDASTVSERQARVYADAIRDTWIRRRVIGDALALILDARNPQTKPDELIARAKDVATAAAERVSGGAASFVSVKLSAEALVKKMMSGQKLAMSTGLRDLDGALNGGLRRREVTILAARTSVGKSLLAAQIAEHIVTEDETVGVLYVTLEMAHESFTARLVSARSGVPLKAIRKVDLTAPQWCEFTAAISSIAGKPLYFADNPTQSLAAIYASAMRCSALLGREGKSLGLVVVDHIGLVKPSAELMKRGSREQQVAETSRGQRYIAAEFGCHVMGLSQINREAEKNRPVERIPRVHQLRESGALEQDADAILILHRDRDASGQFSKDKPAALVLGKGRLDETTAMLLDLQAHRGHFSDWNDPSRGFDHYYGKGSAS